MTTPSKMYNQHGIEGISSDSFKLIFWKPKILFLILKTEKSWVGAVARQVELLHGTNAFHFRAQRMKSCFHVLSKFLHMRVVGHSPTA